MIQTRSGDHNKKLSANRDAIFRMRTGPYNGIHNSLVSASNWSGPRFCAVPTADTVATARATVARRNDPWLASITLCTTRRNNNIKHDT